MLQTIPISNAVFRFSSYRFFLGEIIGSLITPALYGIVQVVYPGITCFAISGQDAGAAGRNVGVLLGLLKCGMLLDTVEFPTRPHVHFSSLQFLNCESNLSRISGAPSRVASTCQEISTRSPPAISTCLLPSIRLCLA